MASVLDRNKNFPGRSPNLEIKYRGIGGAWVREPVETTNRAAALRIAKMLERDVELGTWKPRDLRSAKVEDVASFAAVWIAHLRKSGYSTVDDDEARLRVHVLPVIGHRPLDAVTREEIKELVQHVAAKPMLPSLVQGKAGAPARLIEREGNYAPKTVRNIYSSVRSLFAYAIEKRLIATTPCTLKQKPGELPKARDKDPDWRGGARLWTEELDVLLSAPYAAIPIDRLAFYALEQLCGMRAGEVIGRKWKHLDERAQPLARLRCATQYDGKALKSDGNPREIPVHPVLMKILNEWREFGFPAIFGRAPKPDDWIVPSRRGGLRSSGHMLRKLKADMARVGLRPRTQHDARRTFRSLCTDAGANQQAIDAITHRGSSTSTGDAAGRYNVLGWSALCEAVLCIKLNVVRPGRPGHILRHTSEPEIPMTLKALPNSWRGGRDSNPSTVSTVEQALSRFAQLSALQADRGVGQKLRISRLPSRKDTSHVSGMLAAAKEMRAAADALRSGRAAELTPAHKARMAAACEACGELVADLARVLKPPVPGRRRRVVA